MNDREDENMNIAIVDDDREDAALLEKYMEKYFAGTNGQYHIFVYESGLDFLEDFGRNFDIVFMDIEMPHLDGIDYALFHTECGEYKEHELWRKWKKN